MSENLKQIVHTFYEAVNKGDYDTLRDLYHPKAVYKDELFSVKGKDVHVLWYSALQPEYKLTAVCNSVELIDNTVISHSEVSYYIPSVNKKIHLKKKGTFKFEKERIIHHVDVYSFKSWCIQTFGIVGFLFWWTRWLKRRVQLQAHKSISVNIYSAH